MRFKTQNSRITFTFGVSSSQKKDRKITEFCQKMGNLNISMAVEISAASLRPSKTVYVNEFCSFAQESKIFAL